MSDRTIPPAAVRLYHRMVLIEAEVRDTVTDDMSLDELLAYAADDERVAAALAGHAEFQAIKSEIGRLLGIGPDDTNPLDLTLDEGIAEDDPRYEIGAARWTCALSWVSSISTGCAGGGARGLTACGLLEKIHDRID